MLQFFTIPTPMTVVFSLWLIIKITMMAGASAFTTMTTTNPFTILRYETMSDEARLTDDLLACMFELAPLHCEPDEARREAFELGRQISEMEEQ